MGFNEENPSMSATARYAWEVVRSKSVPPVYRTYRVFDPKKNRAETEPEKGKGGQPVKTRTGRKVVNVKVVAKKQRTLTDLLPVKRTRHVPGREKGRAGNGQ